MNHVDEPRKDESSSSTCRQRRASKLVDLLVAGARVIAPVLVGLACLVLSAATVRAYPPEPGGGAWAWAENSKIGPPKISLPHELPNPPMMAIQAPPVGPAQDAPVRLRDAGPARSVQPLPFVRPITAPPFTPPQDPPAGPSRDELGGPSGAVPVRSVQALPFVRPNEDAGDTALPLPRPKEDAPDKLTTVRPTRLSEAPPLKRGRTMPLRSIADLPLRLSSDRPLSPAQAAAGRSVVRASPLTTIPSGPARPPRLAPTRADSGAPIRSAQDGRYASVQVSLVRPVEGEPIRSVQDMPIGPVQESPVKRPDDALLRPSWHPSLGPSDDQLVSNFGNLVSEAEPRRPLGSGAIELEIDVEGPFTVEPVVPGQAEKRDRPLGSRAAAGPSTESTMGYPPIGSLTTDIRPSEEGTMPPDDAARQYRPMVGAPISSVLGRGWDQRMYLWEPTSFCHRPLYFEEINLERYGFFWCDHRCGGIPAAMVQPVLSGAHFFATVPALPYKMALEPPCECIYTLGHYRPGSCVPHRIHRVPLCPLPAAVEACMITGLVFALP